MIPPHSPISFLFHPHTHRWKSFVAGNLGGVFGLSVAYPLDTIKVRIQTRPPNAYSGTLQCGRSMVAKEGFASLYRGLSSPVVGYGLINAAAFGTYTNVKRLVSPPATREGGDASTLGHKMLAGSAAGFTSSFIRAPIEQVKTIMQARTKPGSTVAPYASSLHCVRDVVKHEGVMQGLFRGLAPTTMREMLQYALYYPAYEYAKLFLANGDASQVPHLSPGQFALAGGVAGVSQWVPTYWVDVVKSRMHNAPPGKYSGTLDCARHLHKKHGVVVFFRGINVSLVRAVPLHGAIFVMYDVVMRKLGPG